METQKPNKGKTQAKNHTADQTAHKLILKLPAMVGISNFTPTQLMIETLCTHIQSQGTKDVMSPLQALKANGHSLTNWYRWLAEREGFMTWWNAAIAEYHSYLCLPDVYNAIYRRALRLSSADAKLYLERFDKAYKPATAQEHTFPGIEPQDAEEAVERSRERAKEVSSQEVGQGQLNAGQEAVKE